MPQDAHEFLCLLLDALHDDSNGAIVTDNGPPPSPPPPPPPDDLCASGGPFGHPGSRSSGSRTVLSDWEEISGADDAGTPAASATTAAADGDEWGFVQHSDAPGGKGEDPGGAAAEVDSLVSKFMGGRLCSEVRRARRRRRVGSWVLAGARLTYARRAEAGWAGPPRPPPQRASGGVARHGRYRAGA